MALAAIIAATTHAGLADPIKAEYRTPTEAEIAANPNLKDHMVLDVSAVNGYGLDNVEALKSNLGREKTRADNAESAAAAFKDLPKDAAKRLERLAELEKLDPTAEADKIATQKFEAAKAELIAKHEEEKKPLQQRAETLFSELDKAKRVQAATAAIVEEGGNPDVLLPHVLSSTKFVEKDGKFDVSVVDGEGNVRIGDSNGGPMSLKQLVAEFKSKDAFAPLFSASGKSGGGATGGTGTGGAAPTGKKKSEMDLNSRAQFIEEHGQEAYLALPA